MMSTRPSPIEFALSLDIECHLPESHDEVHYVAMAIGLGCVAGCAILLSLGLTLARKAIVRNAAETFGRSLSRA